MNTKSNNDTPHFSIADVIIIIALIAVVTAFGLRIYNIFGVSNEADKVRIEFEVSGISSDNISLKEEDKLYYAADDSLVGYLEEFTVTDMVQYAYNEEGELVKATVPGKSTVTGTIVMDCTKTEKGFYLGGTVILSEGGTLTLYTTTREMEIKIIKITEIESDEEAENTTFNTQKTDTTTSTEVPTQK